MERGKLIVFEGINGSGKETQMNLFKKYFLESYNKSLYQTKEPNEKLEINGEKARELLRNDGNPMTNREEALEYCVRNRVIQTNMVVSLLENGIDVLSRRNYLSSFAYQGAQGLSHEKIKDTHSKYSNGRPRIPDLTFILDVPVEIAFERLTEEALTDSEARTKRKFDKDFSFIKKVRENYLELPDKLGILVGDMNIRIIDGIRKPEDVHKRIIEVYERKFPKEKP